MDYTTFDYEYVLRSFHLGNFLIYFFVFMFGRLKHNYISN